MKWVTREKARVDRIACPWLISRFIDREPVFLFVPPGEVMKVAEREQAIPYDVPNVELGHHGDHCSFDAFLDKYKLDEPALRAMAWEGRYLVLGFASGTIPKIPLNLVMLKGCAIMGVFWTAFVERYPEKHRANMIELLDWCKRGLITPHIHASFALIETAQALSLIEGRKVTGKVIVNPQR